MMRRAMSTRPASWSRSPKREMAVVKKSVAFVPLAETIGETTLAVDEGRGLHDALIEVAFDLLGAARWSKDPDKDGFARAAVASALDELSSVAERMGVRV